MVYSATLSFAPPEGAGTLENLVASLIEEEFHVKTHRHGRNGQADQGVDIYYKNPDDEWIGIQCKNTDKCDFTIIEKETERAEEFEPDISEFIVVTTAPQDAEVQRQTRIFSDERVSDGKFPVSIWMWNDIRRLLSSHKNVFKEFYSQLFTDDGIEVNGIEDLGLIRVNDSYFNNNNPRNPEDAWKTNFSLSEVHTGYPFSRLHDGKPVEESLIENLQASTDTVVLGRPGSGKSTILKQVAMNWYSKDFGQVLYRSSTDPNPLRIEDPVFNLLEQSENHTLFIVEDALREDDDLFELINRYGESDDVTFLLESRLDEWENYDDVKLNRERPKAMPQSLDTVLVPELSKIEVHNAVEQYQKITEQKLGVDEEYIYNKVTSHNHIGEIILLSHFITQFDTGSVTSALDSDLGILHQSIRSKIEEIQEMGDLQLNLSVLIVTLQASGISPHPELLHSLDAEHREISDGIQDLQGILLHGNSGDYYRTYHAYWCSRFLFLLSESLDRERAIHKFEDCVNSLFRVFDNNEKRNSINQWFRQDKFPPDIEESTYADLFTHRICSLGERNLDLVTLFPPSRHTNIELPKNVTKYTKFQVRIWRGIMRLRRGGSEWGESDLDIAQQEFEDLITCAEDRNSLIEPREKGIKSLSFGNLATIHRLKGEFNEARSYLEKSISIDKEIGDLFGLSTTFSTMGDVAQQQGDFEQAEQYYRRSIKICRQYEDYFSWAKLLGSLAALYINRGEIDIAENLNQIALRVFDKHNDEISLAKAYGRSATIADHRGNFGEAESYREQSITLRTHVGDKQAEAEAWLDLCTYEIHRQRIDKAEEYAQRAKVVFEDTGNEYGLAMCNGNLAMIDLFRGNLSDAEETIKSTVEVFKKKEDIDSLAAAYSELGHVAEFRGEIVQAIEYFNDASKKYHEIGNRVKEAQIYFNRADCQFKIGNYLDSICSLKLAGGIAIETNNYSLLYPVADYIFDLAFGTGSHLRQDELLWSFLGYSVAQEREDDDWKEYFEGKFLTSVSARYPHLFQIYAKRDNTVSQQLGIIRKIAKKPSGKENQFGSFSDGDLILQMVNSILSEPGLFGEINPKR